MKKLIIDNYDSFTYNLYHLIGGADIIRNDELTIDEIIDRKYSHIFISPGPGSPNNKKYFGVCSEVILRLGKRTPILGICLGMQGIWHSYGGSISKSKNKMHGKTSIIEHNSQYIFNNINRDFEAMRYHSLVVNKKSKPNCLDIIATSKDDLEIMAIKHKRYPIYGIQFHPESFATEFGKEIIKNFLEL
jgi:anthranilate synthase component 2